MDAKTPLLINNRYRFGAEFTLGRLLVQGIPDGYVMEDEIRSVKVKRETAIPYGIYELAVRQSPKFSKAFLWSDSRNMLIKASQPKPADGQPDDWRLHDLIWLKNVTNFEYVLIHWGNTEDQTDGCLLVGRLAGKLNGRDAVLESQKYYMNLYPRIYPLIRAGGQYIEIKKAA